MKKILFLVLINLPFIVFSQGISSTQQRKLNNVLMAVSNLYVDSIDDKKIVENTIVSFLKELDPHSTYIPKEEVERVQEPLKGNFEGIGVQFQMLEDTLFVVQTISGCPAEKVGILLGDRIIYIEDELIAGVKMQNTQIMERLRGPKGTEVNVKVLRRGISDLLSFKIVRDKIPIYTVDASYMIGKDIGYIKINSFGGTTIDEYKKAFDSLEKQGMKHLILNLQGNGGGYLGAAIELSDQFLSNDQLIVYTEGLYQRRQDAKAVKRGNFETGKLIILVDEYSASASEITAGAVQDWDRGIIIGRRTFGKGLVQRELPLGDGSLMRLTTARYYTPTGRSIQKPYKDGVKKYEEDLRNRFRHGEMMFADSIHFPDSLKYQTLRLGRTVYGGGGIMPDIFIPMDTAKYTDYHYWLVRRGVMSKTSIQYIETHREELKQLYPTFEAYKENYVVDDDFISQLIENGKKERASYNKEEQIEEEEVLTEENPQFNKKEETLSDEEQMEKSKDLIKLQLKAFIARDMWDTNEYYRIMDKENESIKRAVEILQTPGEYEKILK